jgi:hypothetical protein
VLPIRAGYDFDHGTSGQEVDSLTKRSGHLIAIFAANVIVPPVVKRVVSTEAALPFLLADRGKQPFSGRVLEVGRSPMSAKIVAAISQWRLAESNVKDQT